MYNGENYIVLVGGAGSVSDGGSIQLWFYDTPELWALNMPLDSSWKAEFIPRSDSGRTWTANAGTISAVVSQRDALAIVSFKFTARYPGVPFTHEIEGAVAGSECNTVIELKREHHAASPRLL
ncbi:hypothetical protein JV174_25495, partial [Pseudomonas sp. SDM007_2]|uniref:hypothetical protein n=1 Tax=Pseudomonas hygromyciniae TaxID=2812000 RepID=UPI001967F801